MGCNSGCVMNDRLNPRLARRKLLWVGLGVGPAVVAARSLQPATAGAESKTASGRARYQPNSADVQNFYRVNRYPKE